MQGWRTLGGMMRTKKGRELADTFALLDAFETTLEHADEISVELGKTAANFRQMLGLE